MSEMNAQELLWYVPNLLGNRWWVLCSVFAMPGAVLCFLYLVMNEPMSITLISRLLRMGGLISLGLTPLNSGWIPWSALLLAAGCCMSFVLSAIGWYVWRGEDVRTWVLRYMGVRHKRREDTTL